MMNPCEVCRHRRQGKSTLVDLLKETINEQQSEIEGYADWMKKFQQVYTRLPVGVQTVLLQELQKEGMVKTGGRQDAD